MGALRIERDDPVYGRNDEESPSYFEGKIKTVGARGHSKLLSLQFPNKIYHDERDTSPICKRVDTYKLAG